MSTIDSNSAQEVIDQEFEVIVAQPQGLSAEALAEAKAQLLEDIVDTSATLDTHKAASFSATQGYEATFKEFLGKIVKSVRTGIQHKELAEAFKADNAAAAKRGESKPHTWTAVGPLSNLEAVGYLLDKGDTLPDNYVWRTSKDGLITLRDGEKSVTDLVTSVIRPTDAARDALREWAKQQGIKQDAVYGKKMVESIIRDGADIDEIVTTLEKTAKRHASITRAYNKALEEAKKAAAGSTEVEEEEEAETGLPAAEALLAQALTLIRQAQGIGVGDADYYADLKHELSAAVQSL